MICLQLVRAHRENTLSGQGQAWQPVPWREEGWGRSLGIHHSSCGYCLPH